MGVPRSITIPKDCLTCTLRQKGDFCDLPQPLMSVFNAIGHLTLYPANATLLVEGQNPRGVYIACSGRAKLSTSVGTELVVAGAEALTWGAAALGLRADRNAPSTNWAQWIFMGGNGPKSPARSSVFSARASSAVLPRMS